MGKFFLPLRHIFIKGILLAVICNYSFAAAPDAFVAVRYVQANLQTDYETAVKLTHPEAQQRLLNQAEFFAKVIDLLKKQPATEQVKFTINLIKTMYGTDDSRVIRSLSPLDIFKRSRQALATFSGSSDIPADVAKNAKVSYIGLVQESSALVHVIVSVTYVFGSEELTIRDSIRLKPLGDGWLVDGAASSNFTDYFGDLARLAFKSQGLTLP